MKMTVERQYEPEYSKTAFIRRITFDEIKFPHCIICFHNGKKWIFQLNSQIVTNQVTELCICFHRLNYAVRYLFQLHEGSKK